MKYPRMIRSLLENDMYKFSMGQAIYHQFSDYETVWGFKCRNEGVKFTQEMLIEIKEQFKAFCELQFTDEELEYLDSIEWIKKSYTNYLRIWRPRYEDVEFTLTEEGVLDIQPVGTWLNTSMYEVPLLAIVNETYFRETGKYDELIEEFKRRFDVKLSKLMNETLYLGAFSEFGLRRRLSAEAQDYAVEQMCEAFSKKIYLSTKFIGTSNVYLAYQMRKKGYNIVPTGTQAHEWAMCVGQGNFKHNPAYSNWYALDAWVKEYGVLNGTALTDCITTDVFLKDFKKTYATLFSGVRHDSGDPYEWGDKLVKHFESLGIDPKTKTLLFSDSLNFEKADKLFRYFRDKAIVAFGIGTYISNDTSMEPLNIVLKVIKCNGRDVAKISDTKGKGMCRNPEYVEYLQRCIDWRMQNEK